MMFNPHTGVKLSVNIYSHYCRIWAPIMHEYCIICQHRLPARTCEVLNAWVISEPFCMIPAEFFMISARPQTHLEHKTFFKQACYFLHICVHARAPRSAMRCNNSVVNCTDSACRKHKCCSHERDARMSVARIMPDLTPLVVLLWGVHARARMCLACERYTALAPLQGGAVDRHPSSWKS